MVSRQVTYVLMVLLLLASCSSAGQVEPTSASGEGPFEPTEKVVRPEQAKTRSVEITVTTEVRDVPEGTRVLDLWIPLPQESRLQEIRQLTIQTEHKYEMTIDPKFGNRMVYFHLIRPPQNFDVVVTFEARRYEDLSAERPVVDEGFPIDIDVALASSHMTPINPTVRQRVADIIGELSDVGAITRRLYDNTLDHMQYSKEGQGWGYGNYQYACDVGKGNCTDFHSYFITHCRNAGIPAYFEIGLSLPDAGRGELGGYHCWAYFFHQNRWNPVDISEADKNPDKAEFFYGNHDANRIAFSRGRDVWLNPRQRGGTLNYFINPYAEVDGVTLKSVNKKSRFRSISW